MRTKVLIFLLAATALFAAAETTRVVIQSGKLANGHNHNEIPSAVYSSQNCELRVDYIANDSLLSVTLTDPSGEEQMVNGSSPSISVPITGQGDGFVVTVRTADGSTFDGVFSRSGAGTVTLSNHQALQLAKNRRLDTGDVECYSATVDRIINDSVRCPITSMPTVQWACDTTVNKWLIVTDERPGLATVHEHGYYYMPKTMSVSDTVQVLTYTGNGPSHQVKLTPLNFTFDTSAFHRIGSLSSPSAPAAMPSLCNGVDKSWGALVICPDFYNLYDYVARWNECSALYTILTQKYHIPKSSIILHLGNLSNYYDFDNNDISADLDGDGVDDYDRDATRRTDYIERVNALHPYELLVYYAAPASLDGILGPVSLEGMSETLVHDRFANLNARNVHFVMSTDLAEHFVDDLMAENRTVSVPSGRQFSFQSMHYSKCYYSFAHGWLSALAGHDIYTGLPLDYDVIGYDSVPEYPTFDQLVDYAGDIDGYQILNEHAMQNDYYDYHPYFYSNASPSAALGTTDSHSWLLVRQQEATTPADVTWDSPNIWVRDSNDGLVNQESECIQASAGSTVYVYTRLTNKGNTAYTGGMNLHLFWCRPYISLPYYDPNDYYDAEDGSDAVPTLIGTLPINGTIMPDSSVIVSYQWQIPTEVSQIGANIGNLLSVNLSALVSSVGSAGLSEAYDDMALRKLPTKKNLITLESLKLPRKFINAISFYHGGEIPIRVFSGNYLFYPKDLVLIADTTHTTGDVFTNSTVYIDFGDSFYPAATQNTTVMSGQTPKYRLNGLGSSFVLYTPMTYDGGTIYFGWRTTGGTVNGGVDQKFHISQYDINGICLNGQGFRLVIPATSGGVGGIMPGINAVQMDGGNYSLTGTNVSAPATYEWYDLDMNKMSEGKTVVVNRKDIGDVCVLKVTLDEDGNEGCAVANLAAAVPSIDHISPVPMNGDAVVSLTSGAVEGMSVRVVSVTMNQSAIETSIPAEATSVVLPTTNLPAGQYAVCLLHNGGIVQSVNVVK